MTKWQEPLSLSGSSHRAADVTGWKWQQGCSRYTGWDFIWENCGNGCNVALPESGLWLRSFSVASESVRWSWSRGLQKSNPLRFYQKSSQGVIMKLLIWRSARAECHSKDRGDFLHIWRYHKCKFCSVAAKEIARGCTYSIMRYNCQDVIWYRK